MAACSRCMQKWLWSALTTGIVTAAGLAAAAPPAGVPAGVEALRPAVELLDRMPLLFVPEPVPDDGATGFVVRGRQASVWLSPAGLAYRLHPAGGVNDGNDVGSWVVALDLVGAAPREPVGSDLLPTRVSHFTGPREQWRTGLPSYSLVRYPEPWPGVDLEISGAGGELKSSFVVRPGADPGTIRLAYRGASAVRLEPDGSLVAETPLGEIRELAPFAYQEVDGRRVAVASAFVLEPETEPGRQGYRFEIGPHDPARELVVDPVTFVSCGYIGGSGDDRGYAVAVDGDGSAYITGVTASTQATFPATVGPDSTYNGGNDVFVAKLNAAGTALDYCGYIGGANADSGYGIAVDAGGNAYVTGDTLSNDSPSR